MPSLSKSLIVRLIIPWVVSSLDMLFIILGVHISSLAESGMRWFFFT